jgi:hypothetical protein
MQFAADFRDDRVTVCVDYLNSKLMVRPGFGAVIGELEDEDHAKRSGVLLPPKDSDASAEDERLALADLSPVGEECVIELHYLPG